MNLRDRILTCKRCGHEWVRHIKSVDVRQCPKCKTAWWDTEKKKKGK